MCSARCAATAASSWRGAERIAERGQRRVALPARPRGPRDRTGPQAAGVRTPGAGARHRRSEPGLGLPGRHPRLRHRGADPGRPRGAPDAADDQQSGQVRGPGRVWPGDRRARPAGRAPVAENLAYLRTKQDKLGHLLDLAADWAPDVGRFPTSRRPPSASGQAQRSSARSICSRRSGFVRQSFMPDSRQRSRVSSSTSAVIATIGTRRSRRRISSVRAKPSMSGM